MIASAFERRRARGPAVLGIGSALVLGLADAVFTARGRISPVYLGDAAAEAAIVGAWLSD